MRSTFAIRLLGGTIIEAAEWIGVVDVTVRQWARLPLVKPPTRDRVLAAALRKAAAQAQGVSSRKWWAGEDVYNARLEQALALHSDRFVELFRDVFAEMREEARRAAASDEDPPATPKAPFSSLTTAA